jgi:hypothetical protein
VILRPEKGADQPKEPSVSRLCAASLILISRANIMNLHPVHDEYIRKVGSNTVEWLLKLLDTPRFYQAN